MSPNRDRDRDAKAPGGHRRLELVEVLESPRPVNLNDDVQFVIQYADFVTRMEWCPSLERDAGTEVLEDDPSTDDERGAEYEDHKPYASQMVHQGSVAQPVGIQAGMNGKVELSAFISGCASQCVA